MWHRTVGARLVPLLIIVASGLPLAAALLSQYVGSLVPCELCLLQRLPYVAGLAIGLVALPFVRSGRLLRTALVLAGLAFLTTAGIAVFQVGLEQHWWTGASACSGPVSGKGKTPAEVEAMLMATPVVRCDEVQWSLFGISIAGFNALYGVAAGALALWAGCAAPWRRRSLDRADGKSAAGAPAAAATGWRPED
ncbi:MAG: disulfide bond formation protein B [Rhodospirillaceae bacterium]|nr:disulfide bond formation protein B [Rhodospirillaceae bacterium]